MLPKHGSCPWVLKDCARRRLQLVVEQRISQGSAGARRGQRGGAGILRPGLPWARGMPGPAQPLRRSQAAGGEELVSRPTDNPVCPGGKGRLSEGLGSVLRPSTGSGKLQSSDKAKTWLTGQHLSWLLGVLWAHACSCIDKELGMSPAGQDSATKVSLRG